MGLAGNMKLKTFLTIVGGLGIFGAGALYVTSSDSSAPDGGDPITIEPMGADPTPSEGSEARPGVVLNRDLEATEPVEDPPADIGDIGRPPLDPIDAAVLAWKGRSIPSKKVKDVTKHTPWKINVYQDDPGAGVNRAKVDRDRDDRWEIKYTFAPDGSVSRKIAPEDDENFTVVQQLTETGWVQQE